MPVQNNVAAVKTPQSLKERFFADLKAYPTLTFFLLVIVALFVVVNFLLIEGTFKNPVAIEVNGEKIYKKDWDHRYQIMDYFNKNAAKNPPEFYANLKDQNNDFFVQHLLMKQELAKIRVKVTDKEIDQEIENRAKEKSGLTAFYDMYTNTYHWTKDDIRLFIEDELLKTKVEENFLKSAHIRAIWINGPYGDRSEDQITEELRASYKEKEKYAQTILEKAQKGEDFATLASQFSEDEASKAKGGDIGFISTHMKLSEKEMAQLSAPRVTAATGSASLTPQPIVRNTQTINMNLLSLSIEILDMQKGEIKLFSKTPGFTIVKVEEIKGGNFKTFNEWLDNAKKNAQIKII